jgi:hypothetical protein
MHGTIVSRGLLMVLFLACLRSTLVAGVLRSLEAIVSRDPGGRGIRHLTQLGGLHDAAAALVAASRGVAVLTGFPCVQGHSVPTENDGLAGAVAIARAALLLGKPSVEFVTDECNKEPLVACRDWLLTVGVSLGEDWSGRLQLHTLPPASTWTEAHTDIMSGVMGRCDHWVAIERAGRAVDGRCGVP